MEFYRNKNNKKSLYHDFLNELYEYKSLLRKNNINGKIMKKRLRIFNEENTNNIQISINLNNNEKNNFNEDEKINEYYIQFLYEKSLSNNNNEFIEDYYNINTCKKIIEFILNNTNNEINEYCFIILGNFFLSKKNLYTIDFFNFVLEYLKQFNKEEIELKDIIIINYLLWLIQIYIINDNNISQNLVLNLNFLFNNNLHNYQELYTITNKQIYNEFIFNLLNIVSILLSKKRQLNELNLNIYFNFFYQINFLVLNNDNILLSLEIINCNFENENININIQSFINVFNFLFDKYKHYKNENEKIIIYLLLILQKSIFLFQNSDIFSSYLSDTKIIPILIQNYFKEYKLLQYILNILLSIFEYGSINKKPIVICINYNLLEIIINQIKTLNGINVNIIIKYLKLLIHIIQFLNENKIEYSKLNVFLESIKFKLEQFTLHSNKEISQISNSLINYIIIKNQKILF